MGFHAVSNSTPFCTSLPKCRKSNTVPPATIALLLRSSAPRNARNAHDVELLVETAITAGRYVLESLHAQVRGSIGSCPMHRSSPGMILYQKFRSQ